MDYFSKSDPVLYCEVRDGGSSEPWKKLGHTGASLLVGASQAPGQRC